MKLIRINGAVPKRAVTSTQVRDKDTARLADILDWVRDNQRGTVWWSPTQFRDRHGPPTHTHVPRKTHFKDGYWVYRFWFSRKADAALFILWWGYFRNDG